MHTERGSPDNAADRIEVLSCHRQEDCGHKLRTMAATRRWRNRKSSLSRP